VHPPRQHGRGGGDRGKVGSVSETAHRVKDTAREAAETRAQAGNGVGLSSESHMAHWQQLTEFIVRLPHRAGELARLAAQLRAANVELISCFGPTEGKSADGFHIVPEDPEQFRDFASKNGLGTWEEPCFQITGRYRGGDLVGALDMIARDGINIQFVNAYRADGNSGILIWVDDNDIDRLAKVLSAA